MNGLPFIETKIIELLLDTAIKNGAKFFSVFDGEEYECPMSEDIDEVKAAIGVSDETTIKMYDEHDLFLGSVFLVHGNLEDVISDCTANEWTDEVMAVIEKEIYGS